MTSKEITRVAVRGSANRNFIIAENKIRATIGHTRCNKKVIAYSPAVPKYDILLLLILNNKIILSRFGKK
jgi:hypothetical protein